MQAFEFELDSKDNLIEIPKKYSQLYSKHIKVIALIVEPQKPNLFQAIMNWRENTSFIDLTDDEVDSWRDRGTGRDFSWD